MLPYLTCAFATYNLACEKHNVMGDLLPSNPHGDERNGYDGEVLDPLAMSSLFWGALKKSDV